MIGRGLVGLCCYLAWSAAMAQSCGIQPVQVQVLGSGGPELRDRRASSSYLVWLDGKARVLVDIGGGAALRFGESGATVSDLDVILLTHLHADHTADLPALIHSAQFEERSRPLPLYGPGGNKFMPSTVAFVRSQFDGVRGAYRYLGDTIHPLTRGRYKLKPQDVRPQAGGPRGQRTDSGEHPVYANDRLEVRAARVHHGELPALAWRVDAGGKSVVFSGDSNGSGSALAHLTQGADLLIAHHAIAEQETDDVARRLHMPPSTIGHLAQTAGVRNLVLSHRMRRTLGREENSLAAIRRHYSGPVQFANDLDCFAP